MTKIIIFKKNGMIEGFQIKGHSGYAEEGSDIVCSAISVAGQMALCEIQQVLKAKVNVLQSEAFLQVEILEELEKVQPALSALEIVLEDIQNQYAKYVKMEVKERC